MACSAAAADKYLGTTDQARSQNAQGFALITSFIARNCKLVWTLAGPHSYVADERGSCEGHLQPRDTHHFAVRAEHTWKSSVLSPSLSFFLTSANIIKTPKLPSERFDLGVPWIEISRSLILHGREKVHLYFHPFLTETSLLP